MTKKIILCLICFIAVIIFFSIFKGPTFIFVKYHYYCGYFKLNSKKQNEAIIDFTKAINLDKSYQTAYISRGSAYVDLKQYDKAISDYSIAIKLSSNDPRPYGYRGRAYYEINNTKKSIADFNKAISLDKNFGYAYLNRALVKYTKMNDFNGGCEDLKKASDLGEDEAKEHLKEGVCK
jgi:tetratricopeptide (TPR) repeat protein